MNLNDAITILVNRIGFEDDGTLDGVSLDSAVTDSDSGRFFQDEHSAVTLRNIQECQPKAAISDADFNAYLVKLKKKCVRKVLTDCLERDQVNEAILTAFPAIFDNAIITQMVILTSEIIMTSVRLNSIERLTDSFIRKLNYDIFRDSTNSSKAANKYTLGLATRYGMQIESLQRRFGQQRNLLKTITAGEQIPNWSLQINEDLE